MSFFNCRKSTWAHLVSKEIYLDRPYQGQSKSKLPIYKFGVTNDIRELWFDNCAAFYRREDELQKKIEDAHLGDKAILTTKKTQIKRARIPGALCVCCILRYFTNHLLKRCN